MFLPIYVSAGAPDETSRRSLCITVVLKDPKSLAHIREGAFCLLLLAVFVAAVKFLALLRVPSKEH